MPPRIDDRWVWLGFGVFLFFAARNIRYAIKDTIRLTEIDPAQFEDDIVTSRKQPEDCKSPIWSPFDLPITNTS